MQSNTSFIFRVFERQITDKVMLCYKNLVPEAGLEPARFLRRGILNPLCLPISPLWQQGAKIMHDLQL